MGENKFIINGCPNGIGNTEISGDSFIDIAALDQRLPENLV